jgi:hypothetical protein
MKNCSKKSRRRWLLLTINQMKMARISSHSAESRRNLLPRRIENHRDDDLSPRN